MKDNEQKPVPPRWATRLLRWYCASHLVEEIEGDLKEEFDFKVKQVGLTKAKLDYIRNVFGFIKPFAIRRKKLSVNNNYMIKSYFKIGWRNLLRNKGYSFINIGGLAVGMAVAMMIGLWIWDEVTYNSCFEHHSRIARVLVRGENSSGPFVIWVTAPPFGNEIRNLYGSEFKHVLMTSRPNEEVLSVNDKKFLKTGYYFEPGIAEMLSLKMLKGSRSGLMDKEGILLSESTAKVFFGDNDPMNALIKIDNKLDVIVRGVYEDLPENTDFSDMSFIATWDLYVSSNSWLRKEDWRQNGFATFVELADHADMKTASDKIRNIRLNHASEEEAVFKFQVFLHPMDEWRLYSDLEQGEHTGRIRFVWLYGIIGVFVLVLACINFMNLATARSEKRAREVGIRKSMGSIRGQLVSQFFSESILVTVFSFFGSLVLVQIALPFFNEIAEKKIVMPWLNVFFWLPALIFVIATGFIAGSYPALYLSSFEPIKVLKGTFRVGRFASLPRKILVVLQFTVSITLIIGVIVVFQQIQIGKNRSVGYNQEGLVSVKTPSPEIHNHIDAVRNELKKSGMVAEIAESLNPVTNVSFVTNGYDWTGNGPDFQSGFPTIWISHEYGKTLGWQFIEGRDFSRNHASDTSAIVINEAALKYMNLKDPIGKIVKWTFRDKIKSFEIIGVIKDMLMESPYYAVRKTIYMIDTSQGNVLNVRINPEANIQKTISEIESVFNKYNPASPFEYNFVDQVYNRKFSEERQLGKLAFIFAGLAIFISCLGIFGLASFVAEQRTKEIGIRKVLGASVLNVWKMLSQEFVVLVLASSSLAVPLSLYLMSDWLEQYEYRTELSWWIFTAAGFGALLITLLTVSFQSIKAGMTNPVKSLRSE